MNTTIQNSPSGSWSRVGWMSGERENRNLRVGSRFVGFVLNMATWVWFATPIEGIAGKYWGGGWRYLTMWILTLNLVVTALALWSEFSERRVSQTLVSMALTASTTLACTYWSLYFIDPQLLHKGGPGLPLWIEFHAHLFSGVFIFVEARLFSRSFVSMTPVLIGLVLFSGAYTLWSELVIPAMNIAPCNNLGTVCGYAYPFLNELSDALRIVFNIGCVASLMTTAFCWRRILHGASNKALETRNHT